MGSHNICDPSEQILMLPGHWEYRYGLLHQAHLGFCSRRETRVIEDPAFESHWGITGVTAICLLFLTRAIVIRAAKCD